MVSFTDRIETREQLREIIGEPPDFIAAKTLPRLDGHCRTFLDKCRFVALATADAAGNIDVSPKGDPEGFVRVLDDEHVVIPDRPGNHRLDSIENILQNPHTGLICVVPGARMTLRINGKAMIVRDQALLDSMKVNDRAPQLAIVIKVDEAFFHCSKCMIRSDMWAPDKWPDSSGLPSIAQTMIDAGKLDMSYEDADALVVNDEQTRLY